MLKNKIIIQISRKIHFHSHISDEMIRIDLTECTSYVFSCIALLNLNLALYILFLTNIWNYYDMFNGQTKMKMKTKLQF